MPGIVKWLGRGSTLSRIATPAGGVGLLVTSVWHFNVVKSDCWAAPLFRGEVRNN